jgi:hypothetical protein
MNDKGVAQIAFLPILLFVIIVLVLTTIIFSFFPSLAIAAALGAAGAFGLFHSIKFLDNKSYQIVFVISLLFIFSSLFVGVAQPFSVFGDELRLAQNNPYATKYLKNTYFLVEGLGNTPNQTDLYSKSFLSNSNLKIVTRALSRIDWSKGGESDYGVRCGPWSGSVSKCVGDVAYWEYKVLVDDVEVGRYGNLGFTMIHDAIYDPWFIDFFTMQGWTHSGNSPCHNSNLRQSLGWTAETTNLMCTGRVVSTGYWVKPGHFSTFTFNKDISLMNINRSKMVYDLEVVATPRVLQKCFGCSMGGGGTYIDPNNAVAVKQGKDNMLQALGITPKEEYYSKISMTGRSNCTSSGWGPCSYVSGGAGIENHYQFDITTFPELQQKYAKRAYTTKIYIEPEECGNTTDYVTRMFTVSAGDKISLTPEVGEIGFTDFKTFCHTLPVLKQAGGIIFEQDYEPYEALKRGETITIPSGQVWIFFYKGLPSSNVLTQCADGEGIYDYATNRCVVSPTIEYECVSGVFDPVTKTCLVQAVVNPICSEGVYNQSTGKCEVVAETVYVCNVGTYNPVTKYCEVVPEIDYSCSIGTYNSSTQKCEVVPLLDFVCIVGTYSPETKLCEKLADTSFICEEGVYNPSTGACDVVAETEYHCENGEYNDLLGVCVVNPAIQNVCPVGVYDATLNKCINEPDVFNQCNTGIYNETMNKCVIEPNTGYYCPVGVFDGENCVVNPTVVQGETNVMKNAILVVIGVLSGLVTLLFVKRIKNKGVKK